MTELKENKMGSMPVKSLILNMSLPMMASMLVQALYNVVDSIFVAQLSEKALTAVTLAFPLQNLMTSVAAGTGVGVNALLSRALGERNYKHSDKAANMAVLLSFINYIVFFLVDILAIRQYVGSQTQNVEIFNYCVTYLNIVMSVSIGLFFEITFERLLQSTGRTVLSMYSQILGALINIILDPIMIFGLFGFPRLGVAGAAYATVTGQCLGALLGLILNLKFNKEIHLSLKEMLTPEAEIIGKIYYVGVPSILMMSIGSVMTYLMNLILMTFSETATAVFGIYFKLQSFFFMPVFGLNNGVIPVLAFNYGAGNKTRIDETIKFSLKLAFIFMTTGAIIFELIPGLLLRMFNASGEMLSIGIPALRIIALSFPIASIGIVLGSVFQAFSKSFYSLFVSLGRQIIVLIPAAYLLSQTGRVNNVWWSFLIAEVFSLLLSLSFFRRIYRTDIRPLEI